MKRIHMTIFAAAILLFAGTSFATTWTVDDDGKADFDNIQAAIDASSSGDEIIVMPGTYTDTGIWPEYGIMISNKDIYLHSSDGPATTIIDGENTRRCMVFYEGVSSATTVEGFTFQNGYGAGALGMGGGMYIYLASPNITNCVFQNNYSPGQGDSGGGGAVSMRYCNSPTIFTNCVFSGNVSESVGGALSARYFSSAASLFSCTFCENEPEDIYGPWSDGGNNTFWDAQCFNDCNENGIDDLEDIAYQTSSDCDQNSVPDECQPDCDGDGLIDPCETEPDIDGDGIPDNCEEDCNGNTAPDHWEIKMGWVEDCNENGIPDECDLTVGGQVPEGAVQWTIEEGGNGHWYVVIDRPEGFTWLEAASEAIELGSYIGSITSLEEDLWVYDNLNTDSCWIGAYQDINAEDYNEPSGGWRWMSGEPWEYTNWNGGGPDNGGSSEPEEELASYCCGGLWNDIYEWDNSGVYTTKPVLIEFEYVDNDCDGNGAIDTCEIDENPSLDCNSNGILDECELYGEAPEGAIQWTIEEGGNGHWYGLIPSSGIAWSDANSQAIEMGGYLVTLTSEDENDFVVSVVDNLGTTAPWIGLYQDHDDSDYSEPAGGWKWVTSESYDYTKWNEGEPGDDGGIGADYANIWLTGATNPNELLGFWNDWIDGGPDGYIIEFDVAYSSDCNSNSIPDECDIADGTSTDLNSNDIPDECETDCNSNGVPDHWDIKTGESQDCNDNGIPDECDIEDGTSNDVNENDIPDECEVDCNGNGVPDSWDIETGAAIDCNGNGIPDSCDVAAGCVSDCNLNGVPDECDITSDTSEDINMNNIPDDCECIADITGDGVVNIHDLLALIGYWGSQGPLGDFNADGIVNIHDLLILIAGWGECTNVPCGPPMAGAVQWLVEDGGNNHWYGLAQAAGGEVCFDEIRLLALDLGGDLVIIQSDAENSFVTDLLTPSGDYWIGLIQNLSSPEYSEPSGGWEWIDGTPLDYSHWDSSEPDDPGNTENVCGINSGGWWYDMGSCDNGPPQYAVVEWSD